MKSSILLRSLTMLLGAVLCVALLAAGITTEVPMGGLRGTLTMKENGKALPTAWVTLEYVGGSDETVKKFRHLEAHDGAFEFSNIPSGIYRVEADTKAHVAKQRSIMVEEGKATEIALALDPKDPELELYASQRVFTPKETPSFELKGFDPADKVAVHYYKLDLGQIVAKGGLTTLLYSFSRPGNEGGSDPSKSSTSSETFDKKLGKDIEGVFTQPVDLPKLGEGFYYVRCDVGKQSKATFLNVSTIGLVTKTSGSEALCYVADLMTGQPIQGAKIQGPGPGGLATIGTTDQKGTAAVTVPKGELKKALLLASYGGSQAVLDFDNENGNNPDKARIFIYSDRPIYRPGDKVQFKGIIRKLKGLDYSLPGPGQVAIDIRDSSETEVKKFTLPVSAKGTFSGDFLTNVEDKPGVYSIHAAYDGAEFSYYVNLAAYRKPEFSITVSPVKKFFVYGDRASATIKAEYYFGGPVVGAKVEAYVTRSPRYYYDSEYADDEDGESGSEYYNKEFVGEYSDKIEATTNEKGIAVIEFDTKKEGDPAVPDYDLDYMVNASISDQSNKSFDGTGSVPVTRGDVSANLDVDKYVAEPGDNVNALVTVKRQDNGAPVVGLDVSVEVGTERWNNDKAIFTSRQTLRGRTDAKGVATIPIKIGEEGSLVLKAAVPDSAGRTVMAEDFIYVEGDARIGPPTARFTMTLDKKSYQVGDRCKVLIQTDKPGGSAMVTVQAEKVLATYVVNLTKQSTIITLPVLHSYAPNVWIGAVAIRNKHLLEAQSKLVVNLKEHDLNVSITPDRADYQPGDTANLTVKTTDSSGRPVPAEVSIGVVDESIYAIRPDTTNIKKNFYPMREDSVRTHFSFEEIYLDGGDKAGGSIPVRSKFVDTADWKPTLETDASGSVKTSIKLPDNLTSWRTTVVGVSDATQVGIAHVNFRARKPLMVRVELPSFLVQQDTQRISAIITNDTGQDQDVNVRLDADGVQVSGSAIQKVHVSAAKPFALTWDVATPKSGRATFKVSAWIDQGAQDAEERSIEIQPHGRLLYENHSGEIQASTSTTFTLSPTVDRTSGRLLLSISPSVGSSIYQSLDELINFPYGCTEQTMSRFLPTVVLSSTLKEEHIRSDLEAKVPAIVSSGFARLAKMQHSNGAWGWWEYDDADMYMTAYVLDGLQRAKAAGYDSNQINTDQTITWAKAQFKNVKLDEYNQRDFLYLCYAVSLYGSKAEVREAALRVKPVGSSAFALLALVYNRIGETAGRDEALARLHDLAKIEGDIARFEGGKWEYGVETASFPLIALTSLEPKDPLIPKLVRYLMVSRQGDMWNSTRDTSLALVGLTQYMKLTSDHGKATDIDIVLNGGAARRIHFDPTNPLSPDLKITIPVSDLKAGENKVEFRRTGDGLCYYGGELKQTELQDHLLPTRDTVGLSITRNYYLLEPQHLENGSFELKPSKRGIDQARSGDLVRVELTINSTADREFILVEDPIPSGCRITEREYIDEGEEWTNWWSQIVIRDDRAAFFIRTLPSGVQKLTYTMRAEQIGDGHALPPTIANMYDSSQRGSGGESFLKVTE